MLDTDEAIRLLKEAEHERPFGRAGFVPVTGWSPYEIPLCVDAVVVFEFTIKNPALLDFDVFVRRQRSAG